VAWRPLSGVCWCRGASGRAGRPGAAVRLWRCAARRPGRASAPAAHRCWRNHRRPPRPTPAPPGLPACVAGAEYDGPMRELILGYKERGRRDLTPVLGHALAGVVRGRLAGSGCRTRGAGTGARHGPAAVRARHGDHMHRLARRAAADLRRDGYDAAVGHAAAGAAPGRLGPARPRAAGGGRPRRVRGAARGVAAGGPARDRGPGRGRPGGRRTHDRLDAGRGGPADCSKWRSLSRLR
jgi:hypothetical protein